MVEAIRLVLRGMANTLTKEGVKRYRREIKIAFPGWNRHVDRADTRMVASDVSALSGGSIQRSQGSMYKTRASRS
jgi:hypothetical protein